MKNIYFDQLVFKM